MHVSYLRWRLPYSVTLQATTLTTLFFRCERSVRTAAHLFVLLCSSADQSLEVGRVEAKTSCARFLKQAHELDMRDHLLCYKRLVFVVAPVHTCIRRVKGKNLICNNVFNFRSTSEQPLGTAFYASKKQRSRPELEHKAAQLLMDPIPVLFALQYCSFRGPRRCKGC